MDTSRLTLDHFLSRFQLLRPQMTHETLNQRQAAVLILWFAAPAGAAVDPAGYSFAQTRRTGRLSRRGRGQYRCFAYRRSASRSAGGSRHPAASRGSDWRFTAGRQRDRFSGHPGGRHYSAKSPGAPVKTKCLRCLKCRWRKRCNWVDIIRLMFTVAAIRTAYGSLV